MKSLSTSSFQRIALVLSLIVGLAVGATSGVAEAAPPAGKGPAAPTVEAPAVADLTVMSFNIHSATGTDGVRDLARVRDVIAASGADVIALQEIYRNWWGIDGEADQVTWLADQLGMHYVAGMNDVRPRVLGPSQERGNAILSRYPVLDSRNVILPDLGSPYTNSALFVTLDVAGSPVTVVSTHLSAISADERELQANAIVGELDPTATNIVLGDMNADPRAREMSALSGSFSDAWAESPSRGKGATYPASQPRSRIDVAFTSAGVVTAEVVSTPASDHLPLVAALDI